MKTNAYKYWQGWFCLVSDFFNHNTAILQFVSQKILSLYIYLYHVMAHSNHLIRLLNSW